MCQLDPNQLSANGDNIDAGNGNQVAQGRASRGWLRLCCGELLENHLMRLLHIFGKQSPTEDARQQQDHDGNRILLSRARSHIAKRYSSGRKRTPYWNAANCQRITQQMGGIPDAKPFQPRLTEVAAKPEDTERQQRRMDKPSVSEKEMHGCRDKLEDGIK